MKKVLLALTTLTLLATGAEARPWAEIKRSGTIKVATEGAFPPFNLMKGKQPTGFEVDLANALAQQLGLKVQWTVQPFDSLLIGLNQDRYDFVIASHGITPERQKAVDFSNPHYCTGGAVVTRPGGPLTARALAGKSVAVQVGTTYLANVRRVPGIGEVKTFPKSSDAQAALMAGRVDAWVDDRFLGLDIVKSRGGQLVQGDLLFKERVGMAVKKGNTALLKELNAALAKAQANGTYAKISRQYFGQDVRCR